MQRRLARCSRRLAIYMISRKTKCTSLPPCSSTPTNRMQQPTSASLKRRMLTQAGQSAWPMAMAMAMALYVWLQLCKQMFSGSRQIRIKQVPPCLHLVLAVSHRQMALLIRKHLLIWRLMRLLLTLTLILKLVELAESHSQGACSRCLPIASNTMLKYM